MPTKFILHKRSGLDRRETESSWTGGSDPPGFEHSETSSNWSWNDSLSRTWSNTPNFRVLRKRGLPLPPQPFSTIVSRVSGRYYGDTGWVLDGQNSVLGFKYGRQTWNLPFAELNHGPSVPSSLVSDDELILKVRQKLMDQRTWRAPLFLAESHKTLQMVSTAANRIVRGLRAARRLDGKELHRLFGGARPKSSKTAAGLWLEYQYGWKPLLMDAHDASIALANLTDRWADQNHPQYVSASLSRSEISDLTVSLQGSPSIVGYGRRKDRVSKRCFIKYFVKDRDLYSAASLGLLNPASLAWELLPFSFVADWFAPIGSYFDTLDAGIGLSFGSGFISTLSTREDDVDRSSSSYFSARSDAVGNCFYLLAERRIENSLPSVVPSNLSISPKLGATRLTSAISLMRQLAR